jgi:hypothetical protein
MQGDDTMTDCEATLQPLGLLVCGLKTRLDIIILRVSQGDKLAAQKVLFCGPNQKTTQHTSKTLFWSRPWAAACSLLSTHGAVPRLLGSTVVRLLVKWYAHSQWHLLGAMSGGS